MSVFHHTDKNHRRLGSTTDAERRVPRGWALLIIGALSVLSWGIPIVLFMALRVLL
jgi:hypothetical protein